MPSSWAYSRCYYCSLLLRTLIRATCFGSSCFIPWFEALRHHCFCCPCRSCRPRRDSSCFGPHFRRSWGFRCCFSVVCSLGLPCCRASVDNGFLKNYESMCYSLLCYCGFQMVVAAVAASTSSLLRQTRSNCFVPWSCQLAWANIDSAKFGVTGFGQMNWKSLEFFIEVDSQPFLGNRAWSHFIGSAAAIVVLQREHLLIVLSRWFCLSSCWMNCLWSVDDHLRHTSIYSKPFSLSTR